MINDLIMYQPRPVTALGIWTLAGWRLKVYGIAYDRASPRPELVDAARDAVADHLAACPTRHPHAAVGFVGIHDGRSGNQVFVDRWINSNELLHDFFVSPTDDPANLMTTDADHNSVCVWDLAVQYRERDSWIRHVIGRAQGPDIEAYLADLFAGVV